MYKLKNNKDMEKITIIIYKLKQLQRVETYSTIDKLQNEISNLIWKNRTENNHYNICDMENLLQGISCSLHIALNYEDDRQIKIADEHRYQAILDIKKLIRFIQKF